jgi:two-component system capsular synthesis sensor histidine kinase RcsC
MPSQIRNPGEHGDASQASASAPGVHEPVVLNRYQRRFFYGAGVAISVIIVLLTGVLVYSAVNEHIDHRYTDFVVQRTRMQVEFLEMETVLRSGVLHEESTWTVRPEASDQLVERFAAQHGRIVFHQVSSFEPVLALGDITQQRPASTFAPYLAFARDFSYRIGSYAKARSGVSGYAYSPDRSFMLIQPAPALDDPLKLNGAKSVAELVQRIVPDIGDLTDPAVVAKFADRNPVWFPPEIDPFSKELMFRAVIPVLREGNPLIIYVRNFSVRLLLGEFAETRYDETSMIVDAAGKVLAHSRQTSGELKGADGVVGSIVQTPNSERVVRQYLRGRFVASGTVNKAGWTLIYTFTWRTILADIWPRLAGYMAVMALVTIFMWVLLLLLDHKVFTPGYVRAQRVSESENLNRSMMAAAPSGIALLSFEHGDVLLQNDLMRAYESNTRADEPPLHTQLLGLYDRSQDAPAWQSDREISLKLKDDRVDDLLVSLLRTKYQGNDVLLCSVSNITSLKDTERKLNEARAAADAANQAKSAFLATMSHEIRTPLNAILGNLELLGRSQLSSSQSERLQVITSSSTALLGIINDILDFSKVESGQMTLEAIRFDLAETVSQVGSIFAPLAHEKGLEFECVIDDSLASHYLGDPTKIRQIAANLVSNAIKFTDTGEVLLEVYRKDDTVDDSPIMIGVIDTGIGMTVAQQKTLFSPFSQADSTITRRFGGTGLGLALCRRLAELMKGTILVRSAPGEGSTFVVTLPIRADTSAPQADIEEESQLPMSPVSSSAKAIRVLVVDDQVSNRELIRAQLATLGYEADVAEEGGAALRYFNQRHFDAVMTDINMPGMDGYSLARCLRAQGAVVPIIAITAHAAAEEHAQCEAAGIDTVLLKPILLDTIDRTLRRLVSGAGRRPVTHVTEKQNIAQGLLPEPVYAALNLLLEESLTTLHTAANAGDTKTLLACLHSVRGSFAMIHERETAGVCEQMEQLARNNDIAAVRDAIMRFKPLARAALARRAPNAQIDS